MKHSRILFAIVLLTASSHSTQAQDPNAAMKKCAQIANNKQRLACFDKLAKSTARDTAKDASKQAKQTSMNIIDFLIDGKQWVGKKVIVTGCELIHSNNQTLCFAPEDAGHFFVGSFANREDQRNTMLNCSSTKRCPVTISGTVDMLLNAFLELSSAEIIQRQ